MTTISRIRDALMPPMALTGILMTIGCFMELVMGDSEPAESNQAAETAPVTDEARVETVGRAGSFYALADHDTGVTCYLFDSSLVCYHPDHGFSSGGAK